MNFFADYKYAIFWLVLVIVFGIIEGITDRASVLMIGDRENDIDGARFNGLAACGVLYGYGSREELESAGADYIVSSVEELKKLVLR